MKENLLDKLAKRAVAKDADALLALIATECPSITQGHAPTIHQIEEGEKAIEEHVKNMGHDVFDVEYNGFNGSIESDSFGTFSHVVTFRCNGKDPDHELKASLCTNHVNLSGFYCVFCGRATDWSEDDRIRKAAK